MYKRRSNNILNTPIGRPALFEGRNWSVSGLAPQVVDQSSSFRITLDKPTQDYLYQCCRERTATD